MPTQTTNPTFRRTLTDSDVAAAARAILDAESTGRQIRQLSRAHPSMTIDDAYAVQRAFIALKVDAGRTLRGHKVGLTSKAMQASSQINEPDYGDLLDDMFYGDGSDIPMSRFVVPRVEVELAFILNRPLRGPGCTLLDVLSATEYVVPALEIIDARIEQFDSDTKAPRKVMDTISDNAASAGVVLGGRPVRPLDVDLRWVSALMYRNGVIEESGVAAAVLNHPGNGIAWLANKLGTLGVTLEAGQVILGGSFTRPVAAVAGDTFHVDYGALGAISCRFI